LTVYLYGNVRASDAAESATGAFGQIDVGEFLFLEPGWVIALGVQFIGDFDLFLGAYRDAQTTAFATLFVDFDAAFHLSSPWLDTARDEHSTRIFVCQQARESSIVNS
jgi:hypothetical protein